MKEYLDLEYQEIDDESLIPENELNYINNVKYQRKFGKIITLDSEGYKYRNGLFKTINGMDLYNEKQSLVAFGLYDGKEFSIGYTLSDLLSKIRILKFKYTNISIFAHNYNYDLKITGLFDFILNNKLFDNLERDFMALDKMIYIKYKNKNSFIEFIDSTNYFKMPLKNILSTLSLSKFADSEDYDLDFEEWNDYISKNYRALLESDTKGLYEVISNFINMPDINVGVSLASSSLKTFQWQYMKYPITFPKFLIKYSLDSYRGGFCIPFQLGFFKNVKDYDINSLYPKVMKDNFYSVSYHKEILNNDYDFDNFNYLMNVDYRDTEFAEEQCPILSKVDSRNVVFRNQNNVWITSNEYKALKDNNFSVKINRAFEFYADNIFKEFVNYFYNKRMKSTNKFESLVYKNLLNSLYGKTAQYKAHTEYIPFEELDEELRIIIESLEAERVKIDNNVISIYDNFICSTVRTEPRYSPIIGSETTANARLYNYNIRKRIGFRHIVYTDTDSFFSLKEFPKDLIDKKELGKMKIDNNEKNQGDVFIYAPKDYEFVNLNNEKIVKLKGITKNAIKYEDKYYQKVFKKFKDKDKNSVNVVWVEKEIKRENYKMNYIQNREWKDSSEYYDFINKNNLLPIRINNVVLK